MAPNDFRAHVLQLCDYVEDMYTARNQQGLIYWHTIHDKARQVRAVLMEEKE